MSDKSELNHERRRELIKRLERENAEDLIGPMRECGTMFELICTCCGESKEAPMRCKRRYCPACQPSLAAQKVARWSGAISSIQWPLFVTLTMGNSHDPECIHFIKKAWSKFRRRKLISTKVKGGVATYEITNKGKGWHPHIHAIMDCRWLSLHVPEPLRTDPGEVVKQKGGLAKAELSALWANQIGQDIAIVDVARVYDKEKIAKEVLKYAMKGSDLIESPTEIAPLLRSIKGTRLLAGWGSMHPMPELDPEDNPAIACDKCGAEKSFLPEEVIKYLVRGSDITVVGKSMPTYNKTR